MSATHCGAGCVLGDLIAEWIVFAAALTLAGFALPVEYPFDYVLALSWGILFQHFVIVPMRRVLVPHAGGHAHRVRHHLSNELVADQARNQGSHVTPSASAARTAAVPSIASSSLSASGIKLNERQPAATYGSKPAAISSGVPHGQYRSNLPNGVW